MIKNSKKVNKKSKSHTVIPIDVGYLVTSGTSGEQYRVIIVQGGAVCNCEWGRYRKWSDPRSACSHVQAVMAYEQAQGGRKVSAWGNEMDAKRQHRSMLDIGDGVYLTARRGS